MTNPERPSNQTRRVDEPRPRVETQSADAARKSRAQGHMVDPYDMRADPQPEEPGYGHGV